MAQNYDEPDLLWCRGAGCAMTRCQQTGGAPVTVPCEGAAPDRLCGMGSGAEARRSRGAAEVGRSRSCGAAGEGRCHPSVRVGWGRCSRGGAGLLASVGGAPDGLRPCCAGKGRRRPSAGVGWGRCSRQGRGEDWDGDGVGRRQQGRRGASRETGPKSGKIDGKF